MKKKIITFSVIFIILIIIVLSFVVSFINDRKIKERREEIKQFVINCLEDKYNEKFEIKEYLVEGVPVDITTLTDEVIEKSNFHKFIVLSSRLVEFDVVYIEYLDNDIYLKNKESDILEPGIYDNYIYNYKMRDIRSEIREEVNTILGNVKNIDVSFTDIGNYYIENLLIKQSLDSKEELDLYNKYFNLNKDISNKDFYDKTMEISNGELILDIEVNDYIVNSNLSNFKKKVKKLVKYIQGLGYKEYNINLTFNKYQSANIVKYLEEEKEQIYLIFDYDIYSNEDDSNKLGAYIIDK